LHEIFREGWQWASEQKLNFGGDPDHRLDIGIIFLICHYWKMRKVVNGHKSAAASSHSFILIRQMAAVVIATPARRALAEVCTVAVPIVAYCLHARHCFCGFC